MAKTLEWRKVDGKWLIVREVAEALAEIARQWSKTTRARSMRALVVSQSATDA